jgi:hypothetical protein
VSQQQQAAQALQHQQQVEMALLASQHEAQLQQQALQQQQQLQQHLVQIQQQQQLQQWQQQQALSSLYDSGASTLSLLSPSPIPPMSMSMFDLGQSMSISGAASTQPVQPIPQPLASASSTMSSTFSESLSAGMQDTPMLEPVPQAHAPHPQRQQHVSGLQPLSLDALSGVPETRIDMESTPAAPAAMHSALPTPMQSPPSAGLPSLSSALTSDPLLQKLLFVLLSLQTHTPHPLLTLTHNHAIECYTQGDWSSARQLLQQVLTWRPADGPARVLMEFMARTDFRPPADWNGYRKLQKK